MGPNKQPLLLKEQYDNDNKISSDATSSLRRRIAKYSSLDNSANSFDNAFRTGTRASAKSGRSSCSDILPVARRKGLSSGNDLQYYGSSSKFKGHPKAKSACGDNVSRGKRSTEQKTLVEFKRDDESVAAMFFVKATEKLKLNSSPHRRVRRGSIEEDGATTSSCGASSFANLLHRTPPPIPASLLRRIDQKEVTGVGKVKVMLRVHDDANRGNNCSSTGFFNVDKKRKQITLYEPSSCAASADMPHDRKLAIVAPKMFAFDAIFAEDDNQTEICSSALIEIVHAVISGNDGCLFCFGYSKLGKTKTMIGSTDDGLSGLGVIPCAISWLYKSINELKQKTGTRFSIRVSAIELTVNSEQVRDLLTGYASDCEQSPGVYLRDDPLLGGSLLQNQSELRAATAEKAAFYLDVALSNKSANEESHFLYTMHIYQYNVAAGKGAVAGGRSRLHLMDLIGCDRSKPNCGLSVSGLGNVLLAIFNGQRHLPNREHKITQILKECMNSLTCHATMIAHVSRRAEHYCEILTTVQFASRIHRLRRKKIKFPGISSGVNTVDDNSRLTGSSDFEPSSSEQSADTVIYVGPSDETDGEHPPVCIPSMNSVDNRGVIGKLLKDTDFEFPAITTTVRNGSNNNKHSSYQRHFNSRSVPGSPQRCFSNSSRRNNNSTRFQNRTVDSATSNNNNNNNSNKHDTIGSGFNSAKSSPIRTVLNKTSAHLEERWIDGPRIAKSKVAEGRNVHMMKMDGGRVSDLGKRETWIDGPTSFSSSSPRNDNRHHQHHSHQHNRNNNTHNSPYLANNLTASSTIGQSSSGYGFMDSYKKNMIRNWVETQCAQIQSLHCHQLSNNNDNNHNNNNDNSSNTNREAGRSNKGPYKEFTTFKMCPVDNDSDNGRGTASGQEEDEQDNEQIKCKNNNENDNDNSNPNNDAHRPNYSMEHSVPLMPSTDHSRNSEKYTGCLDSYERCGDGKEENEMVAVDDETELEFIEVEELEELVPMQDCCLQVTEEDIALCMSKLENPLPEVDQEEHPLRVLSQENMTVVSTFTDSLSVINDLDHLFLPTGRKSFLPYNSTRPNQQIPSSRFHYDQTSACKDEVRFQQLSRLHELYKKKFANESNSNNNNNVKHTTVNGMDARNTSVSRWQSLVLSEIFHHHPDDDNNREDDTMDFDSGSVASEPAYLPNEDNSFGKFCENCRVNLVSAERINNFRNLRHFHNDSYDFGSRLHSYRHIRNMLNLRHPDGASNPNLYRDSTREPGNGAEKENNPIPGENGLHEDDDDDYITVPPPLQSKLMTLTRDGFDTRNYINGNHSEETSIYPVDPNTAETFLLDGDAAAFTEDASRYAKARIKKLETSWNHKERLLNLRREQKDLLSELSSAKQKLFCSNGMRNGLLEFCKMPSLGKFNETVNITKDPNNRKTND